MSKKQGDSFGGRELQAPNIIAHIYPSGLHANLYILSFNMYKGGFVFTSLFTLPTLSKVVSKSYFE